MGRPRKRPQEPDVMALNDTSVKAETLTDAIIDKPEKPDMPVVLPESVGKAVIASVTFPLDPPEKGAFLLKHVNVCGMTCRQARAAKALLNGFKAHGDRLASGVRIRTAAQAVKKLLELIDV